MTDTEIIAHWRKGARDSLRLARHAHDDASYSLSLFHCHLAVEKALKALCMEHRREGAPLTHDLVQLALLGGRPWPEEQMRQFARMTEYAVAARYDDPPWAEREATMATSADWIAGTERLLSLLLP